MADMEPAIGEILDDYCNLKSKNNLDIETLRKKAINDIIEVFIKIASRMNRFSDYKSKVKILQRGSKLSHKEKERCNFIIKLNKPDSVTIIKNTINDMKGKFKRHV